MSTATGKKAMESNNPFEILCIDEYNEEGDIDVKQDAEKIQAICSDFNPAMKPHAEWELFISAAISDKNDGSLYTDLPDLFPITSFKGNK